MKTTVLGHSGEQVSALCLGAMYYGTKQTEAESQRLLDMYVDAGGRFIDTANVYARWIEGFQGGESESLLGRWLQARGHRDQLFIATKVGAPYGDVPASLAAQHVEQEVEKSLKRLGIETIDLYYAHRDDRQTPQAEHLEAMNRLVQAGKVRYIAASNWLAWRLEGAWQIADAHDWAHHVAIQQKHSYLIPRAGWKPEGHPYANSDVLEFCAVRNLAVVAYSPLVKGAYTRADKTLPGAYTGPDNEARLAALKTVCAETGATANQVVLAWLMQQTAPTVIPLFSASTPEQMTENLDAVELTLTDDQMQRLTEAGTGQG
jgi:aryl-alcohol dehydrogenase-like predicted oxidoreductase